MLFPWSMSSGLGPNVITQAANCYPGSVQVSDWRKGRASDQSRGERIENGRGQLKAVPTPELAAQQGGAGQGLRVGRAGRQQGRGLSSGLSLLPPQKTPGGDSLSHNPLLPHPHRHTLEREAGVLAGRAGAGQSGIDRRLLSARSRGHKAPFSPSPDASLSGGLR